MSNETPEQIHQAFCDAFPKRNLTGKKFGRFTVIKFSHWRSRSPYWKCACECGKSVAVCAYDLIAAKSKSCGCLRTALLRVRCTTHGEAISHKLSREYKTWIGIRNRCLTPSSQHYKWYGARGIGICGRWMDYRNFLADMGRCPDGFSIERINNDGDYEPGNCKWADVVTQANNRRSNRRIEFDGRNMTLSQWALVLGIKRATLSGRILGGWTTEEAFKPVRGSA